ncbi:MAG: hypothetical protein FJ266_15600 [Planctomycetes bacterium]|nr:hypothetical protein [Planctomycetota bacterium]
MEYSKHELNLPVSNYKVLLFYQKILVHELTLNRPSHELKKLNQPIRAFEIPLPPLAEKQTIVERMDTLMAMIDELEKQVSERKNQSEMLMQSVLQEAFAKG